MSRSLSQRLQALADSYKNTLNHIQQLRTFSATSCPDPNPDERRVELANEIHDSLKAQGDALEILRQEFDDDTIPLPRRGSLGGDRAERERNADLLARLAEDLKSARANFRRAQLAAKRTADTEKKKEREQLFADRKTDGSHARVRPTHEKLTQDELALRSAEDVTMALRRVHGQMEAEVSRGQFAQQTLDESQEALNSLNESYAGTTDLLKASRGFLSQLVRSTWLIFRRLLYGPLILFVWWPLRAMWWFTMTSMGAIGLGKAELASSPMPKPTMSLSMAGMNARGMPTHSSGVHFRSVELPAKGGGWDREPEKQASARDDESMVEKIGRMTEQGTTVDDITEDERKAQEEQPRNTKKRMMEVEVETPATGRDEL
ncbi:Protein transport protein sec20 [Exophiala xenobiotica]|nr:Protein transport protein sec20 [Exophiala xenobiotica]